MLTIHVAVRCASDSQHHILDITLSFPRETGLDSPSPPQFRQVIPPKLLRVTMYMARVNCVHSCLMRPWVYMHKKSRILLDAAMGESRFNNRFGWCC